MPGFEVWQVVKVPFPYTNRPVEQYRPALVIACHDQVGAPALLWVLMITSAANRGWPADVTIRDRHAAGLPADSVVRCAKIATIETSAAQLLGWLDRQDHLAVRDRVAASLFLAMAADQPG